MLVADATEECLGWIGLIPECPQLGPRDEILPNVSDSLWTFLLGDNWQEVTGVEFFLKFFLPVFIITLALVYILSLLVRTLRKAGYTRTVTPIENSTTSVAPPPSSHSEISDC